MTFVGLSFMLQFCQELFVSSDRSSYSDDGLVYIHPLFEIFTHSNDAIDITSVTLSRLNSINAIDVTCLRVECRISNVKCQMKNVECQYYII